MNKDSIIDYSAYILFKVIGPFIRSLPLGFSFFLGRRLGDLFYCFDLRHKAIAYSNIKVALGDCLSPRGISRLLQNFYRTFGQNLIEIFLIPCVDKEYMRKYISIEGLQFINEGFKIGKGVILLAIHEGNWELYNIICANLGFPFVLFVRQQRYPRLNRLLNLYRSQKGSKLMPRSDARQLIQTLKDNQAIGMTLDQGGKSGILVKFFGRNASFASGAVKLALKYGVTVIPAFYVRLDGPRTKIILKPPFEIKRTGDSEKDVQDNIQELVHVFEKYIIRYPQEYLWTYKIWKYGKERRILVLSDVRAGHLRQAQAVAGMVSSYLKEKGWEPEVTTVEVKFKNESSKHALTFSSCLAGKFHCQGCLWCLSTFLKNDVYKTLIATKPDIIISCGSALAPINYVLSKENLAKSIVIMRPSLLSTQRFDLAIMPRHDNPPKRKNVLITEGALNLIDEEYLNNCKSQMAYRIAQENDKRFYIGLLIGGDAKKFHLDRETVAEVIKQVKSAAQNRDADILVTTSRRTSREIEALLKNEFKDYSRCKLLIIANEKNIPEAVGGILGLSRVVIVSPESISMVSEAASSGKYVLVFDGIGKYKTFLTTENRIEVIAKRFSCSKVSLKHKRFLRNLAQKKYIYLVPASQLGDCIGKILNTQPEISVLRDAVALKQMFEKVLQ